MNLASMLALIHRFQEITACGARMRQSEACAGCPVLELLQRGLASPPAVAVDGSLKSALHAHIRRAITSENGNISAAARRLGIHRTSLYKYLGDMGLRRNTRSQSPSGRAPDSAARSGSKPC